jgi:hypothetical protein
MILLQIDSTCSDELKTICEGIYKINDIVIFTWSWFLVLDIIVGYTVQFINFFQIAKWIM